MDLQEWEFLSDDGFVDLDEDGEKKVYVGRRNSDTKSVFNMNYFICPSPQTQSISEPSSPPRISRVVSEQLVPVPIKLDPTIGDKVPDNKEVLKEVIKVPVDVTILPSAALEKIKDPNMESLEVDQDAVSRVFFKKMKENEFVDMKMDSPKATARGIMPQIDAGALNFDDKSDEYKTEGMESKNSPRKKGDRDLENTKGDVLSDNKEIWEENSSGLNLWKWSFTGIGAICSFGVAAATICIMILAGNQRSKQQQQNQKLRFEIYADDKRIKQVVHHATKLNEAISAVRGVPVTRAHISFGGYYDGL